jgi:coenzyme F420-reducing hydrogenase delta subunit
MSENTTHEIPWIPKIAGFLCRWCSYAGADLAGSTRTNYPSSIQIIRVPCTSRISPQLVMKALTNGLDGVLISGCHPGTCHYVDGNLRARRRFLVLRHLLEFMGIDPKRLQMSWVSTQTPALICPAPPFKNSRLCHWIYYRPLQDPRDSHNHSTGY